MSCKLCGRCCYFMVNRERYKCRFLVKTKSRTLCRIYKTRMNKVIYKKGTVIVACVNRINQKQHHAGCPYNEQIEVNENAMRETKK